MCIRDSYSITNPDAYVEANLIGFYNILEACRHSYDEGHTPCLLYTSWVGSEPSAALQGGVVLAVERIAVGGNGLCLEPVSYTHLDVYKRQLRSRLR